MTKILRLISHDPDFRRGFRRGTALVLGGWVIVQVLIYALYPLIAQSQQPVPTSTPAFRIFLPIIIITAPSPSKGVGQTGPCDDIENLNASWYYNWNWGSGCGIPAEFVPMIRDVTKMEYLSEAIENAQASGWLLGFNEPDKPEPYGHLTTPEEGARAWQIIEQQATGIRLVSPALSQDNLGWLWRMVAKYEMLYGEKPRFDAIGAHFYNWEEPGSAQAAKDYLLQVRQETLAHGYNAPIWLTEFAGHVQEPDPEGGHQRIIEEFIPWMKQQSWITRYAWFATRVGPFEPWCPGCQYCSLTYEGGGLTPIGVTYRGIE